MNNKQLNKGGVRSNTQQKLQGYVIVCCTQLTNHYALQTRKNRDHDLPLFGMPQIITSHAKWDRHARIYRLLKQKSQDTVFSARQH